MASLLQRAAGHSAASDYVERLMAAFEANGADSIPAPLPQSASPLVEPLTPREREVLHLLGQGWSNREIAEALVITINGVKKHTSNIYGKLGVHSRTQAVVRAQELSLL